MMNWPMKLATTTSQGRVDAARFLAAAFTGKPDNDDEEDSELGMFVEDEITPTPIQSAYTNLLREKVEEVLDTLPPREARILRLRFGLDNGRTYTLEEVGQKFGLTRERIRQIEGKALQPVAPSAPLKATAGIFMIQKTAL